MKALRINIICIFLFFGCQEKPKKVKVNSEVTVIHKKKDSLTFNADFIADTFDFPVGKPDANGYYNAQKFQENTHLGDDWNAITGGNSDLGDPIFSTANGYVKFAEDHGGGWGNVIRIIHKLPNGRYIESLYAHCDTILVKENDWVRKGDQIGTIGTANGQYLAHLHFEIRDNLELPIGSGYSDETAGYLDPTKFVKENH